MKTEPHGEHEIELIEDAQTKGDRIYKITDSEGKSLMFTGEELTSLCTLKETGWLFCPFCGNKIEEVKP